MKAVLGQVLRIILLAASAPAVRAEQPNPLDLAVMQCLQLTSAWKTISLSDALGQLGGCVQGGYVLFGLEEILKDGKEPVVDFEVRPGTTVGSALEQILRQLPPYEVDVASDHLIDLYPKGAKTNAGNLMNLRIPEFNATGQDAYSILGAPRDVIPALNAALTPKPDPNKQVITLYFGRIHGGPPVSLHIKNVTVRQILNAVAEASESSFPEREVRGWVYTFDPAKPLSTGYRYTWATLYSLPYGWKYRLRQAKAPSTH